MERPLPERARGGLLEAGLIRRRLRRGSLAGGALALVQVAALTLSLILQVACARQQPLLVFGAASLADALDAAGTTWSTAHPDAPVAFNFAGSNDLARQIAAGAPADLLISADRAQLDAASRVISGRAVPLLANSLVVIVPKPPGEDPGSMPVVRGARDLLPFARIALPDPEAVPAGVYARQWLEETGVWPALADRVVPALDVRANLEAVASGSLPVGVVYATDAAISDRVTVVYRVPGPPAHPDGPGPKIVYWAAPIEGGDVRGAARFLAWLRSPEAGALFRGFGFQPLDNDDKSRLRDDSGKSARGIGYAASIDLDHPLDLPPSPRSPSHPVGEGDNPLDLPPSPRSPSHPRGGKGTPPPDALVGLRVRFSRISYGGAGAATGPAQWKGRAAP